VELGSVEELVEREMRLLDVLCPPVELDDVEVCEELVGTVEELSELEVWEVDELRLLTELDELDGSCEVGGSELLVAALEVETAELGLLFGTGQ